MWFEKSPRRHIFHLAVALQHDDDGKVSGKNQLVLIGQDLDHESCDRSYKVASVFLPAVAA